MHTSSLRRMEWFVSNYLKLEHTTCKSRPRLRVLDVGSYDVNGSYKQFFPSSEFDYVGLDMEAGPNVDLIPSCPYKWHELETDSFDVVISGQALEHIEFFWITVSEMVRVLKKGGILCLIAPNGFGEHRFPVDCYRFFADGMIALARYTSLDVVHAHTDRQPSSASIEWHQTGSEDSMLIASKPYSGDTVILDLELYRCTPADLAEAGKPLQANARSLPNGILHRAYRQIGRMMGSI